MTETIDDDTAGTPTRPESGTSPGLQSLEPPYHSESGEWVLEHGVTCAVCPGCAFTFDRGHVGVAVLYSCPECGENDNALEATR